jgi:hypothetical protein
MPEVASDKKLYLGAPGVLLGSRLTTGLAPPTSTNMAESLMIFPDVPLNNTARLSVADPGPLKSPDRPDRLTLVPKLLV